MPFKIDVRNIAIILIMAVVGFIATTYVIRRFGD
jgi:hypothetical protein